jgi:hypothetical protein
MSSFHKFDFNYLHKFTHELPATSPFLFRPYSNQSILALTYEGCLASVGNGVTYYSREDMYDRILLWRVPLIALWATTTLPSFGRRSQIFTLVHLIADPIDTVWSLVYKLDLAQRTVRWARKYDIDNDNGRTLSFPSEFEHNVSRNTVNDSANEEEVDSPKARANQINEMLKKENSPLLRYFHEVVALIVTAYDEWGHGEHASMTMHYGL